MVDPEDFEFADGGRVPFKELELAAGKFWSCKESHLNLMKQMG